MTRDRLIPTPDELMPEIRYPALGELTGPFMYSEGMPSNPISTPPMVVEVTATIIGTEVIDELRAGQERLNALGADLAEEAIALGLVPGRIVTLMPDGSLVVEDPAP